MVKLMSYCEICGTIIGSRLLGGCCPTCGSYLPVYTKSPVQNIDIDYSTENNSVNDKEKDTKEQDMKIRESYTLAYTKKDDKYDEQTTYLVDEKNKTAFYFYSDGYEGITAEDVKKILNFLNITYFECSYSNMPERYYNEYKNYKL
jgi:hypothetical protein